MRKHLFGITIFLSIISAAILIFGYFNVSPKPELPEIEETSRIEPRHPIELKVPPRVVSRLANILFDEAKGKMTAVVELEWDGTLPKPESVQVTVGFVKPSSPLVLNHRHLEDLTDPFRISNRVIRNIEWDEPMFAELYPDPNQYAVAEAVDKYEEFRSATELVLREKNYLAMSVPVIVKHKKK
jgi:hypothetical protein